MRMIALNLGDERGAFTMHNPVITWKSGMGVFQSAHIGAICLTSWRVAPDEMFTMYDDCMVRRGCMARALCVSVNTS